MLHTDSNESYTVHVAMLGARMHYAVPRLLYEAGLLGRFYTDFYLGNKPWLNTFMGIVSFKPKALGRLATRANSFIPPERIVSFDLLGLRYWWDLNGASARDLPKIYVRWAHAFNNAVIRYGLDGADVVYGYNSASMEIFEFAKSAGIGCIVEQTIAPRKVKNRLLQEEAECWGDWQPDIDLYSGDGPLAERERVEWDIADLILAGSEFVARTLSECGVMSGKCKVVPYGVSLEQFKPSHKEAFTNTRPLRVLFVGEIGLRKGAPYLLEALRLLNTKSIEAKLVGKVSLSSDVVCKYGTWAKFITQVPRNRITEFYKWADVFVLPSICEGSATVTYEALASGVPVVTTLNAGSRVRDGIDGHIVPIRSPEAIAQAFEHYIENPRLLETQRGNVLRGRERVGLGEYGKNLMGAFLEFLSAKQ